MNTRTIFYLLFMLLSSSVQAKTVTENQLPNCPDSPNCVSSQAKDAGHYIAPFKIIGSIDEAWGGLKTALLNQSRTVITHDTVNTLHATETSLVFRFVDDVDAILDAEARLINIRSASRTGYGDFGVNRKRIEMLRLQLQQGHFIE